MSKADKNHRIQRKARNQAFNGKLKKLRKAGDLLNPTPYSGRNTKQNFKELLCIIDMQYLIMDQHREEREAKQKEIDSLNKTLEGFEILHNAHIKICEERIEILNAENAFLREIIMEFGEYFDLNDLMFQRTHLKMHMNANHRIN